MTNKTAAELRKEIREGYDEYMCNHYAKIQLNFLASLPVPESPIDRMVREAKSRLAVSIEANANYELTQIRKDFSELKRKFGPRTLYEQLMDQWLRTASKELGVAYNDLIADIPVKRSELHPLYSDYANALKTLRQKQREVRELSEEISIQKLQLNSTFGKLGDRHPLDHYGFISPVKELHPPLESAQSYWQRLGQKLKLNSCY